MSWDNRSRYLIRRGRLSVHFCPSAIGTPTSTNPRGATRTFQANRLNLVTKISSSGPFSYEREFLYDGNNNLVEFKIQNIAPNDTNGDGIQDPGEQQQDSVHPYFTHTFTYNTANRLKQQDIDAFGSHPAILTSTFEYDSKQFLYAVHEPEGNVHFYYWDERNLLLETVEGGSDSQISETTHYDYDHNRNLIQVIDDDGNLGPNQVIEYDVFDRPVKYTDEIGNSTQIVYDVASLVRQIITTGQAQGIPGEATNTVLSHKLTEYDELQRVFQRSAELFGTVQSLNSLGHARLTPPVDLNSKRMVGGELVNSVVAYDPDSRTLAEIDDNNHSYRFQYDTADRLVEFTDHLKSVRSFTYDQASNIIRVTDVERSDDGSIAETYFHEYFWDELDRVIASVSHMGNTRRFLYDSRHNLVESSDAMGMVGTRDLTSIRTATEHGGFSQFGSTTPVPNPEVNTRGNTVRIAYDGLSRPLAAILGLRSDGTGDTAVISEIVTSQTWNSNSQLASRVDPNGNTTVYSYDHQNRLTKTLFADNTEERLIWNRMDTIATEVDPRGVMKQFTYDPLERLIYMEVSMLPPGVGQTTFSAWRWDGLSRNKKAEDNDSVCEYFYDSLSRQVKDIQHMGTGPERHDISQGLNVQITGTIQRVFDGVGNLRQQIYPSGDTLQREYDALDRLTQIHDASGIVAEFGHIGLENRPLTCLYPTPSTITEYRYDGNRRVIRHDAIRATDKQRIRGFTYAWDREYNRRMERELLPNTNPNEVNGPGRFCCYNSAYRLTHDDQNVSSNDLDLILNNVSRVTSPGVIPAYASDYDLDTSGNRKQTVIGGITQVYTMQVGLPELDKSMNQYTRIGPNIRSHDLAGNTASSDITVQERFFDCDNRLT